MPTLKFRETILHYEVAGEGPPVLLIQGAGVAGSGWLPQVADLSKEFQCLWFDNRGVGKSSIGTEALSIEQMASDASALMDAVGWESAHVAGHSMGGLIAQQLALDGPKRVRSLAEEFVQSQGSEKLASRVGLLVGTDLADSPAVMMQQLAAMRRHDVTERLAELARIPALVSSAQSDPIACGHMDEI